MKKYIAITAFLALMLVTSTVYAETESRGQRPPREGAPLMQREARMASSTQMREKSEKMEKKEKPEGRRAIPGIVTSVSSTGFTMTGRGQGKNRATTTITVVVTPATIFKIRNNMAPMGVPGTVGSTTTGSTTPQVMATTTSTLASVLVGSKVEVFGKVATSTNIITADKVHINRGKGEGRGDDKMEHRRDSMASGTPERLEKKGLMKKFRDFMSGGSTGSTTSGGPAATGFIDYLSNVLSSWFK